MRILGLLLIVVLGVSATVTGQDFTSIDAACYNGTSHIFYFFSGDQYLRKTQDGNIEGPFKMVDNWKGWSKLKWDEVDAVVYNKTSKTYYFFNGKKYAKKRMGKSFGSEKNIFSTKKSNWEGYPNTKSGSFFFTTWRNNSVDAVAYIPQKKRYIFFNKYTFAIKDYGERFYHLTPYVRDPNNNVTGYVPDFLSLWPDDWKLEPNQFIPTFEYGIKNISAATFDSDNKIWYVFINNFSEKNIEVLSWSMNSKEAELNSISDTIFGVNWPKSDE